MVAEVLIVAVKSIADKSNIKIPTIEQTYSILYDIFLRKLLWSH